MISSLFVRKRKEIFFILSLILFFSFWESIKSYEQTEKIFSVFVFIYFFSCFLFYKEKLLNNYYFIFFIFLWMFIFKTSFFEFNFSLSLIFFYFSWYYFLKKGFLLASQQNFFDGCFFIGLSGLFYPPNFFYILWPLLGIRFEKKTFIKKILSCLLGFFAPLWVYFLGSFIFFDLNEAFSRLEKLYKPSYPFITSYFYIFMLFTAFFLFVFFSNWEYFKRQNFLFKSKSRVYFIASILGFFQFVFFANQANAYAFLMIPFCFYFSYYFEFQKKY